MELLGLRIKELRIAAGLTQKQAAEACKLTQTMFSRFEAGRGDPALSTLRKLSNGLGVSLGTLFSDHPTPPQPPSRSREPTQAEILTFIFGRLDIPLSPERITLVRLAVEAPQTVVRETLAKMENPRGSGIA